MKKPRYESLQDIFEGLTDEPTKKVLTQLLKNGILSARTIKEMISKGEIIVPKSVKTILGANIIEGVFEVDFDDIICDNIIDQNLFCDGLDSLTTKETIFTIVDADMYIKISAKHGIH